jgi:hypothetical protein
MTGAVFDVGRIIADSVVDYPDQAAILDVKELDRDGAGPGVLSHVRQRPPNGPVNEEGGAVRKVGSEPVIQPVCDPGIGALLLQVNLQRRPQAAVFQAGRPEVGNDLAQLIEGLTESVLELLQDLPSHRIMESPLELL